MPIRDRIDFRNLHGLALEHLAIVHSVSADPRGTLIALLTRGFVALWRLAADTTLAAGGR
jgi:hypothetical protein